MMIKKGAPIRESEQMGRLPVFVLFIVSGVVGVARLFGAEISMTINQFGGPVFDVLWCLCLIAAAILIGISKFLRDQDAAAVLEVIAIAFHVSAIAAYIFALLYENGFASGAFISSYLGVAILNCLGRARLLLWRKRWVEAIQ